MNRPPAGDAYRRVDNGTAMFKAVAQGRPDLTIHIEAGGFWINGKTYIEYAGGSSPPISSPSSNAKWVLVCINPNGLVALFDGTSSTNPQPPELPQDHLPIAAVYMQSTDSEIYDDMVYDIRPIFDSGSYPTNHNILTNRNDANGHSITAITDLTTELSSRPTFTEVTALFSNKADIDGTPSDRFTFNKDQSGITQSTVDLIIERGSLQNVGIRWNEVLPSPTWEFTNDGVTYYPFATSNTYILDANETTKGYTKLSVDPINMADPIALGENDVRVFSQAEKNDTISHLVDTGDPHNTLHAGAVEPIHLNGALQTTIANKMDKIPAAVAGNIGTFNGSGEIVDSGIHNTEKISTVPTATDSNLPTFSSGTLIDSGSNIASLEPAGTAVATMNTHESNHNHALIETPSTGYVYVDKGRTDTYIENGSPERPFKTMSDAAADATSNQIIKIAPGTYSSNITLSNGVSLIGSGIGKTVLTGTVATGTAVHSIQELTLTNALNINGTVSVINVHSVGNVIINADAQTFNFTIEAVTGPALIVTNGIVSFVTSTISSADASAILQVSGKLAVTGCEIKSNHGFNPSIRSTGGTLNLNFSSITNLGGSIAINISNSASPVNMNTLTELITGGAIVCGTANTVVNKVIASSLTGTALILASSEFDGYTPNTPGDWTISPTNVKDALDKISNALATHLGTTI